MFRGDTSGYYDRGEPSSSSLHREKRQKSDSPKEEVPSLEKLILIKLEQDQVKPNVLSKEKWQKLLELDPVKVWLESKEGISWLSNNVHKLPDSVRDHLLEAYQEKLLQGEYGKNHFHLFIKTRLGKAWFKEKVLYKATGEIWLASVDGQQYLANHLHKFLRTEVGEAWFKARGNKWLASDDGQQYLNNHCYLFLRVKLGNSWLASDGSRNSWERITSRIFHFLLKESQQRKIEDELRKPRHKIQQD